MKKINEPKIKRLFGIFSKEYEEYMKNTNHTRAQFSIIDKFLPEIKGIVLDIATGPGIIAKYIKKKTNCEVYGIDYCKEMIKQAKKTSKNINFEIGKAESLPYPDNYFDVVTCSYGFYWFKDIGKVILEVRRVLKPRGRFIVLEEEFDNGDPKLRFSKYKKNYLKELAELENYFGTVYLKNKLESFNFKIIKEIKAPIDECHSTVGGLYKLRN